MGKVGGDAGLKAAIYFIAVAVALTMFLSCCQFYLVWHKIDLLADKVDIMEQRIGLALDYIHYQP